MSRYFTPAALVKVYRSEFHSTVAIALLQETQPPLRLSSLHRLEMDLQLRTSPNALKHWHADQATGLYEFAEASLTGLVSRALELATDSASQMDSATSLHLAAALELGCTEWVSFDPISRLAATETGLKVSPTILEI